MTAAGSPVDATVVERAGEVLRKVNAEHGYDWSDGLEFIECDCGWTVDAYIGYEDGLAERDREFHGDGGREVAAVIRHRAHVSVEQARALSAAGLLAAPGETITEWNWQRSDGRLWWSGRTRGITEQQARGTHTPADRGYTLVRRECREFVSDWTPVTDSVVDAPGPVVFKDAAEKAEFLAWQAEKYGSPVTDQGAGQ